MTEKYRPRRPPPPPIHVPAPFPTPPPKCNIRSGLRRISLTPSMRTYIATFLGTFLVALPVVLILLRRFTGRVVRSQPHSYQERVDAQLPD
jgi:hypothetical protein